MASSPTPAPASIGTFGRLTGTLFSPKETFADIARQPSWIAPLILFIVVNVAVVVIFGQRVGWRSFMQKQFANNPRIERLSPDEREQALERALKTAPIFGYFFAVAGIVILTLIVAAVLLGVFNLLSGAGLNFKAAYGIVTHAYMPGLVGGLLGILVLFIKDPSTIDLENLVASNLGALLSSDAPNWLATLAKSIDLFLFWILFLLATGFSVANPKKISFGKAFGTVLGLWALFVLIRVGFAFAFS